MVSVLYVDDEPSHLEIAKLFLEYDGEYSIHTKTSVQEGLNALKSGVRCYRIRLPDCRGQMALNS